MKYTKSSYSLHCPPSNILTLQSNNQESSTINWIIQSKLPFNYKKQSENIYNAKGRLKYLHQQMQQLQQHNKQVDSLNKQLRVNIRCLRDSYLDHGLKNTQLQLDTLVKQLKKKVTIRTRSDLLIYGSLQHIIDSERKNNQELKRKLAQVENRVYLLQNVMGFDLTVPNQYVENYQHQHFYFN